MSRYVTKTCHIIAFFKSIKVDSFELPHRWLWVYADWDAGAAADAPVVHGVEVVPLAVVGVDPVGPAAFVEVAEKEVFEATRY